MARRPSSGCATARRSSPADSIGDVTVAALAAADVDRDGDTDVVIGGGNTLQLWRNDGAGTFTPMAPGLAAGSRASAISALALGDLDGDGNPDLVVGQAGPPLVAWLGERVGARSRRPTASCPPSRSTSTRLALADADGDFDPDLAVVVARRADAPLHRSRRPPRGSVVRAPAAARADRRNAIAFGGWDAGCEPDAIIAADAGAPTLRGLPTAARSPADADAPAAHRRA